KKAIESGNRANVEELLALSRDNNLERKVIHYSASLCSLVAEKKDEPILRILLDFKADMNAVDDEGRTALKQVIESRTEHAIKFLVEKKANINEKDSEQKTALMLAAEQGYGKIIPFLLKNKANIEA